MTARQRMVAVMAGFIGLELGVSALVLLTWWWA